MLDLLKANSLGELGIIKGIDDYSLVWRVGASVRNSAHGKGDEEGGLAYARA